MPTLSIKNLDDANASIGSLEAKKIDLADRQKKYRQKNGRNDEKITKAIAKIGEDIKKRKELVKSTTMSMERDNHKYLIFMASGEGFHKLVGNSVIFYTSQIASRIGRRYNIKNDTDFYFKSESGVVSIRLNNEVVSRLAAIDVVKDKSLSKPDILVFDLPWTFSDKDIARINEENQAVDEQITSLVIPKNSIPALYSALRTLNHVIYFNCAKMEPLSRSTIGTNIFSVSSRMLANYIELANNEKVLAENLSKIYNGALYIKNNMKIIEELNLIKRADIKLILEKTIEISTIANRKYGQAIQNEKA